MADIPPTGSARDGTGTVGRDTTTGQFTSLREAAQALEGLGDLLDPPSEDTPEDDEATEDEHEAEADEAEDEGSDSPEGTEDEADEAEDEEPGSDDEGEPRLPKGDTLYTVRIDGKDEKVGLSELLSGYQRQSDYTRKTQGLANERKTFEQEQQSARQERAEYAKLLPQLRQALAQGMGQEPDWDKLQAEDEANGTNKLGPALARWQLGQRKLMQVRQEEARVAERQKAEQDAASQRTKAEQLELSRKLLPEWSKPGVARKRIEAIKRTMLSVGFADDDLAIHDARTLVMADKAARYDELMAQRPALRQKMRQAPVVRPGGGTPAPRSGAKAASDRLTKTGSPKDAASLFEHLL